VRREIEGVRMDLTFQHAIDKHEIRKVNVPAEVRANY
jgi:hypothetical protein